VNSTPIPEHYASKRSGRHRVMVCRPVEFTPTSPRDIPERLIDAETYARGVGQCVGFQLVEAFNAAQLQAGPTPEVWAFLAMRRRDPKAKGGEA